MKGCSNQVIKISFPRFAVYSLLIISLCICSFVQSTFAQSPEHEDSNPPTIKIVPGVGDAVRKEVEQLQIEVRSSISKLFQKQPIGFDFQTIKRFYHHFKSFPGYFSNFFYSILEQGKSIGLIGSIIVSLFVVLVIISILIHRKLSKFLESFSIHILKRFNTVQKLHLVLLQRTISAVAIPAFFILLHSFIEALVGFRLNWFVFIGHLLRIWFWSTLCIVFFKEIIKNKIIVIQDGLSKRLLKLLYVLIITISILLAGYFGAEVTSLPPEMVNFLQFSAAIIISCCISLILIYREPVLELLPKYTYPAYVISIQIFRRIYYLLVGMSFFAGILFSFGYRLLSRFLIKLAWSTPLTILFSIVIYYKIQDVLNNWISTKRKDDEPAQSLHQALGSILLYSVGMLLIISVLKLLDLDIIFRQLSSFPIATIGQTEISFWIIMKAILILVGFVFATRLVKAYLDYKIFPKLGLDEGIAYSVNTLIGYILVTFGFLFSLNIVGLNLKLLMVFAGAVGIGIGLGLQNMAGNVVSGLVIIFGRRIRKGDWVQVNEKVGFVSEVNLRATKIKTRDNVEFLIPNSHLTSNVIVNYTLSDPKIRLHIPVGVSYNAAPDAVRAILLDVANDIPFIDRENLPEIWFVDFSDSSINFELLAWIDIRKVSEGYARSSLYFSIFEALKRAGIEIPFPQRDVHIYNHKEKKDENPSSVV